MSSTRGADSPTSVSETTRRRSASGGKWPSWCTRGVRAAGPRGAPAAGPVAVPCVIRAGSARSDAGPVTGPAPTLLDVATTDTAAQALHHLRVLAGPDADLRPGQLEAITDLVDDRARVLCVQRTGWGKSAVYFVATALMRERGVGPTLIVSPLLALMRNQIAAAERLGIRAHTINSTNVGEWRQVEQLLAEDAVDLLLISPERLNHPRFRDELL